MLDEKIVDMYWERSEYAIAETAKKYGRFCRHIAYNILRNNEDTEECVNDTYLSAWNSMPTQRPARLMPFLGKITRNIALNKNEYNSAEKRGGGQPDLAVEELTECFSDGDSVGELADTLVLRDILNSFVEGLGEDERDMFIGRYWFMFSVKEIAQQFSFSESKVKVTLFRLRKELRVILEKEGIYR